MAFAAARMILKDKRRKSKEDFAPPTRQRSKVQLLTKLLLHNLADYEKYMIRSIETFIKRLMDQLYNISMFSSTTWLNLIIPIKNTVITVCNNFQTINWNWNEKETKIMKLQLFPDKNAGSWLNNHFVPRTNYYIYIHIFLMGRTRSFYSLRALIKTF